MKHAIQFMCFLFAVFAFSYANAVDIYNYNDEGIFIGVSEARPDPLTLGNYLIPRNATLEQPPATVQYESVRFFGGVWQVVKDYRNVPYYLLPDRTPQYVSSWGEDLPLGAVLSLPPLTDEEKVAILLPQLRRLVNVITVITIEDFTYNTKNYKLTPGVISQLLEINAMLSVSADPTLEFPIEIVLGEVDNVEDVQTINTYNAWKSAFSAVMQHIKAKRAEGRALKQDLETMTLTELESWVDPRI